MNVWDYLDRAGERAANRKPYDTRLVVGFSFLAGYYALIFYLASRGSLANGDMVRDALLVLGPPVGAIVAALFRTDSRDEQQTLNTGRAFRAIEATAAGGGTPAIAVKPDAQVDTVRNADGSTTQTVTAPDAGELPEDAKL